VKGKRKVRWEEKKNKRKYLRTRKKINDKIFLCVCILLFTSLHSHHPTSLVFKNYLFLSLTFNILLV
jgi:hypothetical protein